MIIGNKCFHKPSEAVSLLPEICSCRSARGWQTKLTRGVAAGAGIPMLIGNGVTLIPAFNGDRCTTAPAMILEMSGRADQRLLDLFIPNVIG